MDYFVAEDNNGKKGYALPMVVMDFYKVVELITDLQNHITENDELEEQLEREREEQARQEQILKEMR